MADKEHLKVLRSGVEAWNAWRIDQDELMPDLSHTNLGAVNLSGANLRDTSLEECYLTGANLNGAFLYGAILDGANLTGANLRSANLSGARLNSAKLTKASLGGANLLQANLNGADLTGAQFIGANLNDVDVRDATFEQVELFKTVFAGLDLRGVKGLETVYSYGPSEISVSTIYRSEGQIPEIFLRSCGVPESFIVQIPALVAAMQPIQFYSCFISYSSRDEEFARRLHSRMREAALRVWFAPEDMKGGDKLYDQIDRAIQLHDRLLLVLSENSMRSPWVETEIRRARKVELREGRRKLFPIRLVSYEALQEWMCIDSTTGDDLAEEVRSYFIPDFSNWKNHDHLEQAFARLLADLKASA